MQYKYQLGFIGSGNMAKAIVNGILNNKIMQADDIIMSSCTQKDYYNGIRIVQDNNYVITNCKYVFLAIKPQIFNQIHNELIGCNAMNIISIMAGVNTQKIKEKINYSKEIIRIMPNTPCSIGYGMSVICNNNADMQTNSFIKEIFNGIGKTSYVEEIQMDTVTSISGSGPAYVYYFIQSMIQGGIQGGLDYSTAKALTLQTLLGAEKMVECSNDDISILIDKVCSKGGTTIEAINTFKENNMDKIVCEGIEKCRKRSEELSK